MPVPQAAAPVLKSTTEVKARFEFLVDEYKKNQNFNLVQTIEQEFPIGDYGTVPVQAARDFIATLQPQTAATIPINTSDGCLHAPSIFDPYFIGLTTITNPYFIKSAYDF